MMMSRGRPKEFDPDDALRAAISAFWRDGYAGTGVAELTRAMGIGRQSLYDTFGDKRQVFIAALERYSGEQLADFEAQLAGADDQLAQLREMIRAFARGEGTEHKGCMAMNALPFFLGKDAEIEALLKRHMARFRDRIAQVFAQAQAAGKMPDDLDPTVLADGMMILAHGMAVHHDDVDRRELEGAIQVAHYLMRST
ncbi:MAG: TetR/AcrR family transcriptional regulator [Rhodospirillales bacterium]